MLSSVVRVLGITSFSVFMKLILARVSIFGLLIRSFSRSRPPRVRNSNNKVQNHQYAYLG